MVKPLRYWTTDELWEELRRIDSWKAPLTGATMMRRNEIWNELQSRLASAA